MTRKPTGAKAMAGLAIVLALLTASGAAAHDLRT
jgi:hypothetical protein